MEVQAADSDDTLAAGSPVDSASVVERLLAVRGSSDVGELIDALGTMSAWSPLGGKANNFAQIGVASDPADALVEKITNGMDAILEREVELRNLRDFDSPRAAAEALLGVAGGHVVGLTTAAERRALGEQLIVTFAEGESDQEPTLVIRDSGIGQHPDDFATTLVSLNEENKRDKFYLLGAYGWGGAAAYAFCDFCIYISRRNPNLLRPGQADEVGWTVVRYNDLASDRFSKTGVYEYLCVDGLGSTTVPRFSASELPGELTEWSGTICVLVNYRLRPYATGPTFRASRSPWVLLNALLFDPVMPFLLRDERPKSIAANEGNALRGVVINGSAARLTWAAKKQEGEELDRRETSESDPPSTRVNYYQTFNSRLSTGGPVTVRYWTLAETGNYKKDWQPTRSYVTPEQAVTITHFGQRHESYPGGVFEKLGLVTLGKFLIAQIDCDELEWREKRQIFSTTRDRLKSTDLAQELRGLLERALKSDESLRREESQRKEKALGRRSKEQTERIRRLLEKAVDSVRENEIKYRRTLSSNSDLPLLTDQPLLDEDEAKPREDGIDIDEAVFVGEPSFIRVLNSPVRVPAGGRGVLRLQIDAPDEYLESPNHVFDSLVTKGNDNFVVDGYSAIRHGLMRCTVAALNASPGDRGRVVFSLLRPDTLPLLDEADLEAVDPPQPRAKPAGRAKTKPSGPQIEPVTKEDWATFGFDEETIGKLIPDVNDPTIDVIYINWDYPPVDAKLRATIGDPTTIENYKEKFVATMGLAVWLQNRAGLDVQQPELKRAAQVFLFTQFLE